MANVSNDAIARLRLANTCCCSNMQSSPFPGNCTAQGTDLTRGEKLQEH
jgi:hypothetical protein